jgi:autotransporter-associated beta strand protein
LPLKAIFVTFQAWFGQDRLVDSDFGRSLSSNLPGLGDEEGGPMSARKNRSHRVVLAALAAGGFSGSAFVNQVRGATQQYFDVDGANPGFGIVSGSTYSWEDANWTTDSTGSSATSNFVQDGTGFVRLYGGNSGDSYTINVGADEPMVGMYAHAVGVEVTVNQTPATNGALDIGLSGGSPSDIGGNATLQGFLIQGGADMLTLNVPITGSGGIDQQVNGALALYGSNTYTGGTQTTGGQVTFYNNNHSFGTGSIVFSGSPAQGLVNTALTAVTIPNDVYFNDAATTNFASGSVSGGPGAIWTGNVFLPGSFVGILSGQATDVTEFRGVISGSGAMIFGNPGTVILSGSNTYTGQTVVTAGKLIIKGDAPRLNIFNNGGADISGGKLIFDYSTGTNPSAQVKSFLTAGFAQSPAFSSGPLQTSESPDPTKGLGWMDDGSKVTVMYTYFGDANLDGAVDTSDFAVLASHFGQTGQSWGTGDFNYDNTVNALDFNALATDFGLPPLSSPALGALVPEPGSLVVLLLGSAATMSRRRRREK